MTHPIDYNVSNNSSYWTICLDDFREDLNGFRTDSDIDYIILHRNVIGLVSKRRLHAMGNRSLLLLILYHRNTWMQYLMLLLIDLILLVWKNSFLFSCFPLLQESRQRTWRSIIQNVFESQLEIFIRWKNIQAHEWRTFFDNFKISCLMMSPFCYWC